jgi:hypothetical protein
VFASVPRDGFYAGIGALLVRALRERPLTVPRIFRLSRGVD